MFFLAPTTKLPNIEPLQNHAASFILFQIVHLLKIKKKLCPVAGQTCFRLAGLTLFKKFYHYDSLHNFFSGTSHYFLTSGSLV